MQCQRILTDSQEWQPGGDIVAGPLHRFAVRMAGERFSIPSESARRHIFRGDLPSIEERREAIVKVYTQFQALQGGELCGGDIAQPIRWLIFIVS